MIEESNFTEAEAFINIALVKYWGKKDTESNFALNPSLSLTLSNNGLSTRTRISHSETEDEFYLNGVRTELSPRIKRVLEVVRKYIERKEYIRIRSENSVRTACGLASSASGFAALAKALCEYYNLPRTVLHEIARIGSGSATRSLYPGFVTWQGDEQIIPLVDLNWPELVCIVCEVDGASKKVSSTEGMERSRQTSRFLETRASSCTPQENINTLIQAIKNRDFDNFAKIVIHESNQLHAICLDTYPPLLYLNNASYTIMRAVHEMNKEKCIAAYTFDAGPNAFIFCLEQDYKNVLVEIEPFGHRVYQNHPFNSYASHYFTACQIYEDPQFKKFNAVQ